MPVLWGQDEEKCGHWDWAKQAIVNKPAVFPNGRDMMIALISGLILSAPFWVMIFMIWKMGGGE